MKFLKIFPAFLLLVLLLATAVYIKNQNAIEIFYPSARHEKIVAKEDSAYHDDFSENTQIQRIRSDKSGSVTMFDFNFLFNLLYKFAQGELKR